MKSPAEIPPERQGSQNKAEGLEKDISLLLILIREKEEQRKEEVKEFTRLGHVIENWYREIQEDTDEEKKKEERIRTLSKELLRIEREIPTDLLKTDLNVQEREVQLKALRAELTRLKQANMTAMTHIDGLIKERERAIEVQSTKISILDEEILNLQHQAMDIEERFGKEKK
ncbi:MAG: hypothetical protein PHV42_01410 [Candidatus Pacebacteria bacterium]|nr:hypothetical protein [Candidatus Paceibacterota bacterium]